MKNELQLAGRGDLAEDSRTRIDELLEAFRARRSEKTCKAYEADLQDFARYTESEDPKSAMLGLISQGPGRANSLALQYKGSMVRAGKSPATVNRRLSALRSVVSLAKTLGLIGWTLEVGNEPAQAYRDTRGPGRHAVRAMLEEIQGESPKAMRDRVIVRLMYDLALRRGEVASLRLQDVDFEGRRVWVKGKGRSGEREALTLPGKTMDALGAWVKVRGVEAGSLFVNYDRAGKGKSLSDTALYYIIRRLGEKVGIVTRPHGIRHAAITEALDRTRDPRAVQRFSRHRDLATILRYDDNREDLAGKVAEAVAAGL